MEERKGFGSNFGFLMAAIGSAVGLGNIWGFPNKMGANGGFTFLIIYLILAVLCGFVVMVGELAIGRKTGKGAIAAYRSLSPALQVGRLAGCRFRVPHHELLLRPRRLLPEVRRPQHRQPDRRGLRLERPERQ